MTTQRFSPRELKELMGLEATATKSPWWVWDAQGGAPIIRYNWDDVPTWIAEGSCLANNSVNFALICQSRNALKGMADELLRLWAIEAAMTRGGIDISPCMHCGEPTACLPDGMPCCDECGKKLAAIAAKGV